MHCGQGRANAVAHSPWSLLSEANPALQFLSTDLSMAAALEDANLAHSTPGTRTSPGTSACCTGSRRHPHSLEPLRPWKAEQLGGGYALSSWAEKVSIEGAAAVIAVSEGMRADVLSAYPAVDPAKVHVIYNGIDSEQYAPDPATGVLERYGVDLTKPSVVFVGRITPAEGRAGSAASRRAPRPGGPARALRRRAGHPGAGRRGRRSGGGAAQVRTGVIWLSGMLSKREVIQLLSHSTLFACPSVYEPLGIVNLEAMACGTAVVASKTGGIPEVVADGETGLLVPPDEPEPLAEAINSLTREPDRAAAMGRAGRERAQTLFDWARIARRPRTSTSRSSRS